MYLGLPLDRCKEESMLEEQFQVWNIIRNQILNVVNNIPEEKIIIIPDIFSNNILWIFGHLIRTRNFLLFRLANEPSKFPQELETLFTKGSSPKNWQFLESNLGMLIINDKEVHIKNLKNDLIQLEENLFNSSLDFIKKNYDKNLKEPYTTSTGFIIDNLQKAFQYNIVHESIHLGQLQLYKKVLLET